MWLTCGKRALALGVMVAAAAVPCLAAEIVLRVVAAPPDTPGLFVPTQSATSYIGRPGAHGLVSGAPVAFNRFGLRDREFPLQKPAGTVRIVVLGDSMAFGLGVPEPRSFPRVTETLLNESAGRPGSVEVLNFGIPGYNTLQELTEFKELGAPLRPNIVVVGFLYNDLELQPDPPRQVDARSGSDLSAQATSVARPALALPGGGSPKLTLTNRVSEMVGRLKRRSLLLSWLTPRLAVVLRPLGVRGVGVLGDVNAQFVDSNPEWRRVQSELLELRRLCREQDARLALVIIPAFTKFSERAYPIKPYHEAVVRFCEASSISCLDLLPALWGLDGTRMWISPTDGHPDAEGHRVMAEAVSRFLQPMVAAERARDDGTRP